MKIDVYNDRYIEIVCMPRKLTYILSVIMRMAFVILTYDHAQLFSIITTFIKYGAIWLASVRYWY